MVFLLRKDRADCMLVTGADLNRYIVKALVSRIKGNVALLLEFSSPCPCLSLIFFIIQSREVWHWHFSFLTAVPTRTLAVVVRGVCAADSMISLFSCCASGPINTLKLVVRWRRRRVFWGGMFRSMASVSPLKRGSRIWEKGRIFIFYRNIYNRKLLQCLAEDFSLSICPHWTSYSSLMILTGVWIGNTWKEPRKNAERDQANIYLYLSSNHTFVWVEQVCFQNFLLYSEYKLNTISTTSFLQKFNSSGIVVFQNSDTSELQVVLNVLN